MATRLCLEVPASSVASRRPSQRRLAATSGVSPRLASASGTGILSISTSLRQNWLAITGTRITNAARKAKLSSTVRSRVEAAPTAGKLILVGLGGGAAASAGAAWVSASAGGAGNVAAVGAASAPVASALTALAAAFACRFAAFPGRGSAAGCRAARFFLDGDVVVAGWRAIVLEGPGYGSERVARH